LKSAFLFISVDIDHSLITCETAHRGMVISKCLPCSPGVQAARAELITRIKAETVGLALFHSLGSITLKVMFHN